MIVNQRLFLTEDRKRVVLESDRDASTLLAAEGDEVPDEEIRRNGWRLPENRPEAKPPKPEGDLARVRALLAAESAALEATRTLLASEEGGLEEIRKLQAEASVDLQKTQNLLVEVEALLAASQSAKGALSSVDPSLFVDEMPPTPIDTPPLQEESTVDGPPLEEAAPSVAEGAPARKRRG